MMPDDPVPKFKFGTYPSIEVTHKEEFVGRRGFLDGCNKAPAEIFFDFDISFQGWCISYRALACLFSTLEVAKHLRREAEALHL